ncbi:AAA family ATPase [Campylobacter ureolyticus]|uniref:AAA family ATPase n=1 Tax=Campylobacter ureolyticus TaxID=827 RepID=UPI0022B2CEF9|nr:ATP-binding protein [Campylobacter ureolyticus]MCZ6116578.1 AAA family ATPase [Campylobacter ureolyticus]
MLKSFCVSGYRSIRDKISIDLKTKKYQKIKNTRYECSYFDNSLSKIAVFFGKNATGKTNIIEALMDLCGIIKKGTDFKEVAKNLNYKSDEISFMIELCSDKDSYIYEIVFNEEKILKESFKENNTTIYCFEKDKLDYKNNELADVKPTSTTFLEILKNTSEKRILNFLKLIYEFYYPQYADLITNVPRQDNFLRNFSKFDKNTFENNKDIVLEVLSFVDDSISGFEFKDNGNEKFTLTLKRCEELDEKSDEVDFAFENESKGVIKIIILLSGIINAYKNGGVCIFDELDSSISVSSLIYFINGFINVDENKAQFIFTSHNVLIFDRNILHPNQIFIIKKEDLGTKVSCLNDFELRNDKKKAYLNYLRGDYE